MQIAQVFNWPLVPWVHAEEVVSKCSGHTQNKTAPGVSKSCQDIASQNKTVPAAVCG